MLKSAMFDCNRYVRGRSRFGAEQCKKPDNSAPTKVTGDGTKTADGLQYWDIKVGTGATAQPARRPKSTTPDG